MKADGDTEGLHVLSRGFRGAVALRLVLSQMRVRTMPQMRNANAL